MTLPVVRGALRTALKENLHIAPYTTVSYL